ncbi:UNVERIFIED_CONTAM: E3 ubiquitin-protein ligase NRDP1 [Siphonaria sp. JEL0065]|nr:E3 ubiquitin-protein ligase NRDP1 [Siphonaria sp. JEL0065]
MNILDRTVWQYALPLPLFERESLDEYVDAFDLRCGICTEPLSEPVVAKECRHVFCKACLEVWRSFSALCPVDRIKIDEADLESFCSEKLDALLIICKCGYTGTRDTHRNCELLKCRYHHEGCPFYAQDGTALNLHSKDCTFIPTSCSQCNMGDNQIHRQQCSFQIPLLDWAPSLSFGMSPTDLMKILWPSDEDPYLPYTSLSSSPEITSFECKSYSLPYVNFYTMDIFKCAVSLPSPLLCDFESTVVFMFQKDFGLRMISFRLLIDCNAQQLAKLLYGDFCKRNAVPRVPQNNTLSVSKTRSDVWLAVGRNVKNRREFNIELFDARVEFKGGFRVHAQVNDDALLDLNRKTACYNDTAFLDSLEFIGALFEDVYTESLEAIALLFANANSEREENGEMVFASKE